MLIRVFHTYEKMLLLAQQNTIYYSEAAKNQGLFSLHFKQKSMDIYINQQEVNSTELFSKAALAPMLHHRSKILEFCWPRRCCVVSNATIKTTVINSMKSNLKLWHDAWVLSGLHWRSSEKLPPKTKRAGNRVARGRGARFFFPAILWSFKECRRQAHAKLVWERKKLGLF